MGQAMLLEPKFTFPVLALGGAESWGRGTEPVESLRAFASNVAGRAITDCGHWIAEEQPEILAQELNSFFEAAHRGASVKDANR